MTTFEAPAEDNPFFGTNSTETIHLGIHFRATDLAYIRANRMQPAAAEIFNQYFGQSATEPELDERMIAEINIINARLRGVTDVNLETFGIFDAPELSEAEREVLQLYEAQRWAALHKGEADSLRRLGLLPSRAAVTIEYT